MSAIVTALICLAMVAGCRLMGSGGPVSKEMAACRQFAQRGQSALDQGDLPAAEALFAQAIKAYPDDAAARRYYADVLWRRGAQQKALRQAEEALRLAGDDPANAVQVGEMNLAIGGLDEARRLADSALDVNPQTAAAWALRARVAAREGQLESALADMHRALAQSPGDRQLMLEMAELYRALGRPQQALATLIALRESYADSQAPARLRYLEGLALAALGRDSDAIDAYLLAIEQEKPSPELLARLAEAQLRTGNIPAAAHAAQQALAIDSSHAMARAVWQQVEGLRMAELAGQSPSAQ